MPNAQCPMHMSDYNAAWTASLLMSLACRLALCSFCPSACCKVQLCISFVELPILSFRLASWLASVTRDNRTGRKKTLWSGLRYPAIYCQHRIITFWYPLNWRWTFSQCTQIISLLQSSWPAPQFRCSLVKKRDEVNIVAYQETQQKGKRWIWLQIRKHRGPSYRRVYAGG